MYIYIHISSKCNNKLLRIVNKLKLIKCGLTKIVTHGFNKNGIFKKQNGTTKPEHEAILKTKRSKSEE